MSISKKDVEWLLHEIVFTYIEEEECYLSHYEDINDTEMVEYTKDEIKKVKELHSILEDLLQKSELS